MQVSEMIDKVTAHLVDNEEGFVNVHWSRKDLLTYMQFAVSIVSRADRSRYSHRVRVDMIDGQLQDIPKPCDGLTSLLITDKDGKLIEIKKPVTFPEMPWLCKDDKQTKIESVFYTDDSPNNLIVMPAQKESEGNYLYVQCFMSPDVGGEGGSVDILKRLEPAVFELMLYYAYSVDIESAFFVQQADTHWNHGMLLITQTIQESKQLVAKTEYI